MGNREEGHCLEPFLPCVEFMFQAAVYYPTGAVSRLCHLLTVIDFNLLPGYHGYFLVVTFEVVFEMKAQSRAEYQQWLDEVVMIRHELAMAEKQADNCHFLVS